MIVFKITTKLPRTKDREQGMNDATKQPLWTRDFLSICFCCLFIFITYYALVATLPMFIVGELNGDNQQIGLVMAALVTAAIFVRPFAGNWLDQFGRKKVLWTALFLYLLATISYIGIQSILLLIALRLLHGFTFGAVTTAMATIVADLTPEQRKGEGIGYYAMFMNLAMIIGPFMGLTIVVNYGFSVLFGLLSFCACMALLFGSFVQIPLFGCKEHKKEEYFHWKNFIEPNAVPISFIALLISFGYGGVLTFIPVYAEELGIVQAATYFFPIYALVIVLSRPFTGRLFDRYNERVVIYPSIILFVIGLITLSFARHSFLFLIAAGLIGLGFGTLFSCLQVSAIRRSSGAHTGRATGTYLIFFDTGIGVGSFILGHIAASMGYQHMYLISSIIVATSVLFYYRISRQRGMQNRKQVPLSQNNIS
nr:MFS transporter [Ammoniphilus sp. CFH 90114]